MARSVQDGDGDSGDDGGKLMDAKQEQARVKEKHASYIFRAECLVSQIIEWWHCSQQSLLLSTMMHSLLKFAFFCLYASICNGDMQTNTLPRTSLSIKSPTDYDYSESETAKPYYCDETDLVCYM